MVVDFCLTSIECCNIVATFQLFSDKNKKLDLEETKVQVDVGTLGTFKCEYNPKKFSALVCKSKKNFDGENKTTILIFRTGRCVVCGAKSLAVAYDAAQRLADILHETKNSNFFNFCVQNIVGSMRVGGDGDGIVVNLSTMYESLRLPNTTTTPKICNGKIRHPRGYCIFEPEIYGALRYYLPLYAFSEKKVGNIVALVFASRSVIISGALTMMQLQEAAEYVRHIVQDHLKKKLCK